MLLPWRRHAITGSVAVALVAGCGGGQTTQALSAEVGKPARQVLQDAAGALRSARTVHLDDQITSKSGAQTISLDVAARDRVRAVIPYDGAPLTVTLIGGRSYFSGRRYWEKTASPGVAELIGDRCVLVPSGAKVQSELIQALTRLADLQALATVLVPPGGQATKAAVTTVGGHRVIPVSVRSDAGREEVLVSAVGTPYPLQVTTTATDGSTSTIRFSQYDSDVSVVEPKDCIDTSRLSVPSGATPSP